MSGNRVCTCPRLDSVARMSPGRVVWGSRFGIWSRVCTVKLQNMLCFVFVLCITLVVPRLCVCVRKCHDG